MKKILAIGIVSITIMLVFTVYYNYNKQYSVIIDNYLDMESEIIQEAKQVANLWFNKRIIEEGAVVEQIEQEILSNIIEPIHLLDNGDAWIYNKDYVIFDKSSDFPDYYRGKSIHQIFEMQREYGASHYEAMTSGVENATEGQGWYIWLPEKGKEWVAWTSFRVQEQTWTLGLSTPEKEILKNAGLNSFLIKQIIYFSTLSILLFSMAKLAFMFQKRQEKLIAELKKGRTELQELNIKKDKFFSIIAHDLRNPVSSIIGISNILVEKTKDKAPADVVDIAKMLQQSSGQVMDLLSNLLEWSKNEIEKTIIAPAEFDINKTITGTIELVKLHSYKKNIKFNFDDSALLMVFTDLHIVKTILRNFISNAVKFSHPSGSVDISTEKSDDKVIIEIKDHGIGMDEDTVKNLFRTDIHHSTPGTEQEQGTGLGLILCKEIADQINSEIRVESNLDKGSIFRLLIPIVEESPN